MEKLDDEIEHSKALATWVLAILKANTDRMIDEKLDAAQETEKHGIEQ